MMELRLNYDLLGFSEDIQVCEIDNLLCDIVADERFKVFKNYTCDYESPCVRVSIALDSYPTADLIAELVAECKQTSAEDDEEEEEEDDIYGTIRKAMEASTDIDDVVKALEDAFGKDNVEYVDEGIDEAIPFPDEEEEEEECDEDDEEEYETDYLIYQSYYIHIEGEKYPITLYYAQSSREVMDYMMR